MKSLNIDFPDILSMDRDMKEKYIHFNSHAKTVKHVAKHDLPEADSSIAAIEQYNGNEMLLILDIVFESANFIVVEYPE